MRWWWLSFADANRPTGSQFLGAVLVRAHNFLGAVKVSHALGINPGGEVQGWEADPDFIVKPGWAERLLSRSECEEFDRQHHNPPS